VSGVSVSSSVSECPRNYTEHRNVISELVLLSKALFGTKMSNTSAPAGSLTPDLKCKPKEISKRKESFGRLVQFCRPEAGRLCLGFSALIVNSVTNLSFPWLMGKSLEELNTENYMNFLVTSAALLSIGSAASWVRVYCLGTATDSISARLKKKLFESYMDKDLEFFDNTKNGEIIAVQDDDVNLASEALTEKLASGVRSLNSAVNGSIILYLTSPRLCAVTLSVVPVVGVGAMMLSRYTTALTKQIRALQSDILSYTLERISNIGTVKLNSRESFEKDKYDSFMQKNTSLSARRYNSKGTFMSFLNFATNASLLAVLREGGKLLESGVLTTGSLARFAIQVKYYTVPAA
jgi:ABC-type multidrug transport system fused ATPase/permease subunit